MPVESLPIGVAIIEVSANVAGRAFERVFAEPAFGAMFRQIVLLALELHLIVVRVRLLPIDKVGRRSDHVETVSV